MADWLFFFFVIEMILHRTEVCKKNKPIGDYGILLQEWKEKYFL